MKKATIIWYSPSPSPYNSYLFHHLADLVEVQLKAVFHDSEAQGRPWSEDFLKGLNTYFLKKTFGIDFRFLISSILRKKQIIVIAGWDELMAFSLITLLALFNRKLILFSDRLNPKKRTGLKQRVRKLWLEWVFKRMKYFFITGNCGAKDLLKLKIPEKKIIPFPFATNTEYFKPKKKGENINSSMIFISSGRLLNSHKGYDVAVRAFAIIKNNTPDVKFKYLIAGDGPDRQNLQDLILALNLQDDIFMKGWTQFSELLNFYQSGDVFLHPSHFDPFPNAVMEAMACGLPVIGSDMAGSVIDRVIEGYNGFIHRAGDEADLASKIMNIIDLKYQDLMEMGINSRKTAMKWTVDYNINQVKSVLSHLN